MVHIMMDFLQYISGKGGFLILAFLVVVIVLYNKIKQRRDIKTIDKKRKR